MFIKRDLTKALGAIFEVSGGGGAWSIAVGKNNISKRIF